MSSRQLLNKSQFRQRKRRLGRKYCKKIKKSLVTADFDHLLAHLQSSNNHFSSYTIAELEPICQQMAIQQMSSSTRSITTCPWICLFCENLIYEPMTLYCGHTYCERCIKDEELPSSTVHCPRCSKDTQGQIPSSINYARESHFSKNHFLKQILERSETFQLKRENILLCHQAQIQITNKNYQQAIEIYSKILQHCDDEHMALYGRAKAYIELKQLPEALDDIERVILLKPYWAKGYYCRSEILFEMKKFTAALLSSLKGLALDPEDQIGKQIMARHLHAVLLDTNEREENVGNIPTQADALPITDDDSPKKITASGANNTKLLTCRSTQSSSCVCTLFDGEQFRARDFECSICVNLLWFPVTTPCGHIFCRECLIRSIDNTQVQCPMCKNSLDEFFPMLIQSHVDKTEVVEQIIKTYFPNEFDERHQSYEQEIVQDGSIPTTPPNTTEPTIFEIPIFVCVLTLPNCTCPLHVFEPRYRLMMRRALETQSRSFGMCTYDEQIDSFSEYGTLLFIRGLVYTPDGRSIVDTIGQKRFRVVERGTRDGYDIARVHLIQDDPVDQVEFDALFQLNQEIYNRVRVWFDHLDVYRRTLISQQLEGYPPCDDLIEGSADGPSWTWVILNLLPIEPDLQYTALTSRSLRIRLQMINNAMDFILSQQQTNMSETETDDT